jgi:glycosyltransferase involved in cell wall biosynthesis
MSADGRRLRLLHLHSSFQPGGKELRAAQLMNAFGPGIDHTVISAEPGQLGAASAIDKTISVTFPTDFPALQGRPTPPRLLGIARAMAGFDLVLTYNWGAMDAVMAHAVFGNYLKLPPLVHHEDGFNSDEAVKLKSSRNWYRRAALSRVQGLVVPSSRLERIAREQWFVPPARLFRIANGIPTLAYGKKPKRDALPRVIKQPGELWLGTLAGLRTVKNLPRLVRAFAALPDQWQLVILGEGPERDAIRNEAIRLDIGDRVHLPGFAADPAKVLGLFDLFALSSDSEQFPISVVEAMAGGLAVVSPMVGDVASMVSEANKPFLTRPGDEAAMNAALLKLADDSTLRKQVGEANRQRVQALFDEAKMIAAYRQVYAGAMGREAFP